MPKSKRASRIRGRASATSSRGRSGGSRRLLSLWVALALPIALLLVGTLAPVGLARSAEKDSLREQRKAQKLAEREKRRADHRAEREARVFTHVNGGVRIGCTGIQWIYTNFPPAAGNTVVQEVTINHDRTARARSTFTFDGSSGTNTTPLMAPPGHYQIDTWAHWRTNGARGHFDIRGKVTCPPMPAFTIEKLQTIEGSDAPFTQSQLKGLPGQTVDYEILVTNTGNVPLTLGSLADSKCDGGTLSGGPEGGTLLVGASTTYTCSHLLGPADQTACSYTNSASITATPPPSDAAPFSHTSNTVVVFVPCPAFTIFKLQRVAGGGGFFTMSPLEALPGATIEYELLVKNAGNVPLSMGVLSDPHCDSGTIAGGPSGPLAPGASTTYTCSHVLDPADEAAGSYSNSATLTGTPPEGEGSPVEHTSNTVVVTVTKEPGPPPPGGGEQPPVGGPNPGGQTPTGGVASGSTSTVTTPSSTGVLAFASATVPALTGPQGCARGRVTIRIKSAGVASVIFYLDGHRLRRLTAHSARHGQLTLVIDTSHLKIGRHRLLAKFTMKAASSAKVTHASRAINLLRCASGAVSPHFTG